MAKPVSVGPTVSDSYERRRQRLIAAHARGRILDLGHAQLINPYLDRTQVTGVDLLEPVQPSGYREDLVGSVMELDQVVGDRRFDTVIAAELIEHLERPYDFLRSVRQVVADDGCLVLTTPNPLGFPVLLLEFLRSTQRFYAADHTFYFLPRWVRRMLELTGFELVRTVPVGIWLPFGHVPWAPVTLSYQLVYLAEPR